ncbi:MULTISPECIES: YciI family protein [Phenylobacterium]|uniref:Uncharacterized protein YciI n=1 Tax=Phenylobacterium koreense TaxID=266125 RepID=A0ABV2EIL9_9CAUL
MPLFVLHCVDKPNALELRMATRETHLAYIAAGKEKLKLAGPMLDADGNMAGSMLILDVADLAEAEDFAANDPYRRAGLFERVDVHPFKATLGGLD